MARITSFVQPIYWRGKPLQIRNAPFMEMVLTISKQSPNGRGWQSLTSSSLLYPFDTLETDTIYIIQSMGVNYDIPEEIDPPIGSSDIPYAFTDDPSFIV